VLERSALFVGNDTGIMHIAAAMRAPTLGLFGPSLPEQYAPWGPRTAVVRTTKAYAEIVGAPDYDYRTTDTQMDSLSVDAVEAAARGLWTSATGEAA
jgi:heptosyltransferase-3